MIPARRSVLSDASATFCWIEVTRGVEDYAQAQGYAVILCNSDEAEDKERQYLRVLEEQRVRGILITPVHGRAPTIKGVRDRGTPSQPDGRLAPPASGALLDSGRPADDRLAPPASGAP